MPQNGDILARMADPNQASVFDSVLEQAMRRLAQALQSGELATVAMGATSPGKVGPNAIPLSGRPWTALKPGGQNDLMRRIAAQGMDSPLTVVNDLDKYGYGDLAEGVFDAISGGRRSQITMPGMQRLVKGMGYDEGTRQITQEAANNPEYLQRLLDFVLWRHGPGR